MVILLKNWASRDKDFHLLIPIPITEFQRSDPSDSWSNGVSPRDNVITMQIRTRHESSPIRVLRRAA